MFHFEETFYVEQEAAVSAEKAWAVISKPGGLTLWHPFMDQHIVETTWDGIGSKDKLIYINGFTYNREVERWEEGVGYDLKVTEGGKRECASYWRITPIDDDHCKLRITGEVRFIRKLPFPIRWALLKFKMKPIFKLYLELILKGFAYHAETGEQVKRNQFGKHPLFS